MNNEATIGGIVVGGQPNAADIASGRLSTVVNCRPDDEPGNVTADLVRGTTIAYTAIPFTAATLAEEHIAAMRASLDRAERGLPDLAALVRAARQRFGEGAVRLRLALPGRLAAARSELTLSAQLLRAALRHATANSANRAAGVLPRLTDAPLRARLRESHARLDGLAARLESVSYEKVLARGYALVSDGEGTPITTAKSVRAGMDLRLRFADGEARAIAGGRGETRQRTLPL